MDIRILIWDTDVVWTEAFKKVLGSGNMNCHEVDTLEEYKRLAYTSRYSACVLGMGTLKERVAESVGEEDPKEFWENVWMRLNNFCWLSPVPVILMTEKQDDEEEIKALRNGVSDYIAKERHFEVCLARIQTLIKLWDSPASRNEPFTLDKAGHQLIVGERRIGLTSREYGVLSYLYANFNRAVNRETLLEQVWNISGRENKRVVDTVVKQLRGKLTTTPYEIRSVYKLGYQLQKKEIIKYNSPPSEEMEEHP
ncbi:MAG: hypothetical protein HFH62_02435 [Lachnospiraceae bacterium]|nr:hypothetical protein [Lachnospiraceae bacterium]